MSTPPDAQVKVVIGFEAAGGTAPTGWSETFYSVAGFSNTLLQAIRAQYIPARVALLGIGASLQFIRISPLPLSTRVSLVYFTTGNEGTGNLFTNSPGDAFDPTQVDLLVRMQGATNKRRSFWMGGLPDSVTVSLIGGGIQAAFITSPAFKQWMAAIVALNWGLRYISLKGTPNTYSFDAITTMQPIMVRNRKRGRPFELFRGKRLA